MFDSPSDGRSWPCLTCSFRSTRRSPSHRAKLQQARLPKWSKYASAFRSSLAVSSALGLVLTCLASELKPTISCELCRRVRLPTPEVQRWQTVLTDCAAPQLREPGLGLASFRYRLSDNKELHRARALSKGYRSKCIQPFVEAISVGFAHCRDRGLSSCERHGHARRRHSNTPGRRPKRSSGGSTAVLQTPGYQNGHWGLFVVDARSGLTVYEQNSHQLFAPASVTKLFSVAAALVELGADYRFETPVVRRGRSMRREHCTATSS